MNIKFSDNTTLEILTFRHNDEYLEIQIIDQAYSDVVEKFFNNPKRCAEMTIGNDYFVDYTLRKYTAEDTYRDINKTEHTRITVRMYPLKISDTVSLLVDKIEILRQEKLAIIGQIEAAESKISVVEKQLSNEIDTENMTIEEYRKYKKNLIGKDCQNQIYSGVNVNIDGSTEYFTYKEEDQDNFSDMLLQITCGLQSIPYHSSSKENKTNPCKSYSAEQILEIYSAQTRNKLELSAKCNQIYMWLDELTAKDAMEAVSFHSSLPEKYQKAYDQIISTINTQINMAKILGGSADH